MSQNFDNELTDDLRDEYDFLEVLVILLKLID